MRAHNGDLAGWPASTSEAADLLGVTAAHQLAEHRIAGRANARHVLPASLSSYPGLGGSIANGKSLNALAFLLLLPPWASAPRDDMTRRIWMGVRSTFRLLEDGL